MLTKYFFVFISFLIGIQLQGQDTLSTNYEAYIKDYLANIPTDFTDEFVEPTANQISTWDSCLSHLFEQQYSLAHSKAQSLLYDLNFFIDTISQDSFYVLQRQNNGPHWGLYMENPSACRNNIILMAPHPKKDLNTGIQAAYCFQNTESRFLMISGTNRCNSSQLSSCSGTTSVCGSTDKYPISDLAHNENSIFQQTCSSILQEINNPYFLQLHGFSKKETDPYVIMSNGTRDTPTFDPIEKLSRFLPILDTVLTIKSGHLNQDWNRLLGFFNTNGRLINNSPSPCNQNASMTEGRFLHIEQEYQRLRKDTLAWDKMAHAIRATFPGESCPSRAAILDHNIWYVKKDNIGDGRSWNSAHGSLVDIIPLAKSGDSIFVSTGVYLPSKTDTSYSFTLHTSINLYGGFPLAGGAFAQRDPVNNPTILDGNIGALDNHSDDIVTILKIIFLEEDCELDGFIISQGRTPDGNSILVVETDQQYEIYLKNMILSKF